MTVTSMHFKLFFISACGCSVVVFGNIKMWRCSQTRCRSYLYSPTIVVSLLDSTFFNLVIRQLCLSNLTTGYFTTEPKNSWRPHTVSTRRPWHPPATVAPRTLSHTQFSHVLIDWLIFIRTGIKRTCTQYQLESKRQIKQRLRASRSYHLV